jgi:S1-C subfamily serine protease
MQRKPVHKARTVHRTGRVRPGTARTGSSRLYAPDFVGIVDKYKDAVVNIEVVQDQPRRNIALPFPWDSLLEVQPRAMNIGTGFLFDRRGYILTNEHVIHGASQVRVHVAGRKQPLIAKVVSTHYDHDLAVIKVTPDHSMTPLALGHSQDVRVGEWVLAIGNPLGLDNSVTVGIISAKERPMRIGDRDYPHLLQTDAAINRGNSGGPLLSAKGEVIGINTAVSQSSHGIGFAIAIDVVRDFLRSSLAGLPGMRATRF